MLCFSSFNNRVLRFCRVLFLWTLLLTDRCVKKTDDNIVFRKFTLLLAVNTKGVVGWKLYKECGANTERLEEFLKEHITTKTKGKLIIMDNAGAHKNDTIRNLINSSGNKILYSIPYTPRSNAIENVFSEMKHHLSTGDKTCERLWNRDVNGSLNIHKVVVDTIARIGCPAYLSRISAAASAAQNQILDKDAKPQL